MEDVGSDNEIWWLAGKRTSEMVGENHKKTRRATLMLGGHFSFNHPQSLSVRHRFVLYFESLRTRKPDLNHQPAGFMGYAVC